MDNLENALWSQLDRQEIGATVEYGSYNVRRLDEEYFEIDGDTRYNLPRTAFFLSTTGSVRRAFGVGENPRSLACHSCKATSEVASGFVCPACGSLNTELA